MSRPTLSTSGWNWDACLSIWLLDLTGDTIAWRRADEPAVVQITGPVANLLLIIYKRISPAAPTVTVAGDKDLLDFWLRRVDFG
jgi:hypothetical protein